MQGLVYAVTTKMTIELLNFTQFVPSYCWYKNIVNYPTVCTYACLSVCPFVCKPLGFVVLYFTSSLIYLAKYKQTWYKESLLEGILNYYIYRFNSFKGEIIKKQKNLRCVCVKTHPFQVPLFLHQTYSSKECVVFINASKYMVASNYFNYNQRSNNGAQWGV